MNFRLLGAALALTIVPSTWAADEENPYKKAKVGNFATYKVTTKVAGLNIEGTVTQTVTAKSDKEVTLKSSGKILAMGMEVPVPEKETVIDLTKPFDPTQANGVPGAKDAPKAEKLKEGREKIKLAGKEYEAKWATYKVKAKSAAGLEFDAEMKIWLAAELPIPTLKTEMNAEVMGGNMEMTMELTEMGTKDLEKSKGK